jgi:hypothetical protein
VLVRRWRRLLGRLALIVGSMLLVLLALEGALRRWPLLLGQEFANGALSRYTTKPGGIYYYDRALRMHFMIPNHRATMYYNGYVWRHRTDALGFRNEPLHVPADVMLLGDSVVYGHGVDFEDTVGHRLEERTGLRVANLGHQAYCAFQEAYLLTEFLPVFKPRAVVHVFTPNDIDDLYVTLRGPDLRAFVAQPVDRIAFPPRTEPGRALADREAGLRKRRFVRRLVDTLYLAKLVRWLEYQVGLWRVSRAEAASPDPRSRYEVPNADTDPSSLGWRYTDHAFAYMKYLTDRAGARLVMVPFTEGRQLAILRDIAARHGIEIIDTAPLFAGPTTLPRDGHLSPYGARVMADLIAAHFARRRGFAVAD